MIHKLKTINPYFTAVWNGQKTFELRKNDRNFAVDDIIYLLEFEKFEGGGGLYSRCIKCIITYILDNPTYLQDGFVALAIVTLNQFENCHHILDNIDIEKMKKEQAL